MEFSGYMNFFLFNCSSNPKCQTTKKKKQMNEKIEHSNVMHTRKVNGK